MRATHGVQRLVCLQVAFENVELHPFTGNCTPKGVAAQAEEVQGLLGDNGTVSVDNVTLTIAGTVMMPTVITTTWSDLPGMTSASLPLCFNSIAFIHCRPS